MLGENDIEAVKWISQIVVETREALDKAKESLEEVTFDLEQAWDDTHGNKLDFTTVREGRREELCYMKQRSIWSEVNVKDCLDKTGKRPDAAKYEVGGHE